MSDIQASYLTACHQLALRYGEVTGNAAKATVKPSKSGGVLLSYLLQTEDSAGGDSAYVIESEEQMSLSRAMDSLVLRVAEALDTNARNLSMASIRLGEPQALAGVAAIELYCPTWGGTAPLYCRYKAERSVGAMSVTLYPMNREELPEQQCEVWDHLYAAGIIGELPRVLPWAAQGMSQMLALNLDTGIDACSLLLPGGHRIHSVFPAESLILSSFRDGRPAWQLNAEGPFLQVESNGDPVPLQGALRVELTLAAARWQSLCEAVAEGRSLCPQAEEAT